MTGLQSPIHKVEIGNISFTLNLNTLEFVSFQEIENETDSTVKNEGLVSIYLIGRSEAIEFVCDKQSYSNLFTRWKNFVTQERDIFMSGMEQ